MKNRLLATLCLLLTVGLAADVAAQSEGLRPIQTSAEIRIDLPAGTDSTVAVEPGERHILVDLPRGAGFPLDFAASSGGLLRGGEVKPVGDGRVQLDLEMAMGLLRRIEYEPGAVVLRFQSRYNAVGTAEQMEDQYQLGPGDKIQISVHNHPDLTSTLTVTHDGTITAPLVGDIKADGMSPRVLAARLSESLGRSYLVDPQVFVEVEDYRSQWVMVSGEVRLGGRVPLRGGTRLKEVLSEAGGFSESAGEEIKISSRAAGSQDYEVEVVDRNEFEIGLVNPVVRAGDIIEVSRAAYCYIQGEVRSPSRVRIERGLTLVKALSLVSGFTEWANRKEITVIRGSGPEATQEVFDYNRILEGKSEDPVLMGDEIVIVKRRFF